MHRLRPEALQRPARLEGVAAHGLRKVVARRIAQVGRTPNEIAAITGHRSLGEVATYTRAADQVRCADAAMAAVTVKLQAKI